MRIVSVLGLVSVTALVLASTALAAPTAPPGATPTPTSSTRPVTPSIVDVAKTPPPSTSGDCSTVDADRTVTMGHDAIKGANTNAPSNTHEAQCPHAFIFDVVVGADAKNVTTPPNGPPWSNDIQLEAWDSRETALGATVLLNGVTEQQCRTFKQSMTIYRKKAPAETQFTAVTGTPMVGLWEGNGAAAKCNLHKGQFAAYRATPPSSANETWTYRVVLQTPGGGVGAQYGRAMHDHQYPPK